MLLDLLIAMLVVWCLNTRQVLLLQSGEGFDPRPAVQVRLFAAAGSSGVVANVGVISNLLWQPRESAVLSTVESSKATVGC